MVDPHAKSYQNSTPPSPFALTAKELAERLSVCERTIRNWDALGVLPEPVRIRRAVRWRADEITAWTEAGCPNRETWSVMRKSRKHQVVF